MTTTVKPSPRDNQPKRTVRGDLHRSQQRRHGSFLSQLSRLTGVSWHRLPPPDQADTPTTRDARLLGEEPFVAGTGILGGLVPPIASARQRELAGHESVTDYFLTTDTWQLLVSRFLKPRSKVLDLGCGCGDLIRGLVYHPNLSLYVGLDRELANIHWCQRAIGDRQPEKFRFVARDYIPHAAEDQPETPDEDSKLPVADLAMDLVVARAFPAGASERDSRLLLGEVVRVLCLNGLFLAAIPAMAPDGPDHRVADRNDRISPDRFQGVAEEAGLKLFQRMGLLEEQELFLFTRAADETTSQPERSADDPAGTGQESYPRSDHFLTDEMARLNLLLASEQDVASDVHPDDFIYRFCATHPLLSLEGGIQHYFRDGDHSAKKLVQLIAGFDDLDLNSVKLLEFASGYGCVTRHLRKWPHLDLVSCDIHPQALSFLSGSLGVNVQSSAHHPAEFRPQEKYDVVFALSFFSHMPRRTFGPWLRSLFESLLDPGYLVFTTLGLKACAGFGIDETDIPEDGLWFEARSEQHDLEEAEYGMTIVTPEFVRREVERQTGASIHLYKQVGWWDNQDLWVVKRDS